MDIFGQILVCFHLLLAFRPKPERQIRLTYQCQQQLMVVLPGMSVYHWSLLPHVTTFSGTFTSHVIVCSTHSPLMRHRFKSVIWRSGSDLTTNNRCKRIYISTHIPMICNFAPIAEKALMSAWFAIPSWFSRGPSKTSVMMLIQLYCIIYDSNKKCNLSAIHLVSWSLYCFTFCQQ